MIYAIMWLGLNLLRRFRHLYNVICFDTEQLFALVISLEIEWNFNRIKWLDVVHAHASSLKTKFMFIDSFYTWHELVDYNRATRYIGIWLISSAKLNMRGYIQGMYFLENYGKATHKR